MLQESSHSLGQQLINPIDPVSLAWLTGLFEGEGCMSLQSQGRPFLRLSMVDEDVVRRAHSIAGVGTVKPSPNLTVGGKRMWNWGVGRCDDAVGLIEMMLPLFGERRAARAREVLASNAAAPIPKRMRTHCPRGHPYSGHNLKVDHYRQQTPRRVCRACRVINTQASRDRKAARMLIAETAVD